MSKADKYPAVCGALIPEEQPGFGSACRLDEGHEDDHLLWSGRSWPKTKPETDLGVVHIPDVLGHLNVNYPCDYDVAYHVGKVNEEAGEALGALLKLRQGRTPKDPVEAELADVVLAVFAAYQEMELDPNTVIAARWVEVSKRNVDNHN